MSHPENSQLLEDIWENLSSTHPELWNDYYMGKATLRQLEDAAMKLFEERS